MTTLDAKAVTLADLAAGWEIIGVSRAGQHICWVTDPEELLPTLSGLMERGNQIASVTPVAALRRLDALSSIPEQGVGVKLVAMNDQTYRSPREDAAYYGSIWSLSTNQMAELEKTFKYHRDHTELGLITQEPDSSVIESLAPLADREKSADHEASIIRALASHPAAVAEGEASCECCGGPALTWFAPNKLWNLVQGGPEATDDPGGMLCPNCFISKAENAGVVPTAWVLDREQLSAHPAAVAVTDEMVERACKAYEDRGWGLLGSLKENRYQMRAALEAALVDRDRMKPANS